MRALQNKSYLEKTVVYKIFMVDFPIIVNLGALFANAVKMWVKTTH